MKKCMAIVFAVLMALSMAGCGPKTDAERLVGSWTYEVDNTDVFVRIVEDELHMTLDLEPVLYTEIHTYNEDGTYAIAAAVNSYNAAMETLRENLKPAAEAAITADIESFAERRYDMTLEAFLDVAESSSAVAFYEDSMGISVSATIDAIMDFFLDEDIRAIFGKEGTYVVEESSLRITDAADGTAYVQTLEFPNNRTLILHSEDGAGSVTLARK